jgi:hypothetical protein
LPHQNSGKKDINILSDIKPLEYQESGGRSGVLDSISIRKLRAQPRRYVMRTAGVGHAVERALRGERIQVRTRLKLINLAKTLK